MPVNYLHSLFHRVELGWDPIQATYAREYEQRALKHVDASLLERIDGLSGGLTGKQVLDLGGGPGQYSGAGSAGGVLLGVFGRSQEIRRGIFRRRVLPSLLVLLPERPRLWPADLLVVEARWRWIH